MASVVNSVGDDSSYITEQIAKLVGGADELLGAHRAIPDLVGHNNVSIVDGKLTLVDTGLVSVDLLNHRWPGVGDRFLELSQQKQDALLETIDPVIKDKTIIS